MSSGNSGRDGGRIAYADLDDDPLIAALDAAAAAPHDAAAARRLGALLFAEPAALPQAIADRVLRSTGPFARLASRGLPAGDPRRARAATELAELGRHARVDAVRHLESHGVADVTGPADDGGATMPASAATLRARLSAADDWGALVDELATFASTEGVGPLAVHRVLRWEHDGLIGIPHPDPVAERDLVGGEDLRLQLARSLAAFVAGTPAVDALLYGPPGTGKSTAVRALANAHAADGLRLIQLDRRDLGSLRQLFDAVEGGPRCLVLIDDLVFDEHDRTDRELRGALEGDVAARPANVVVWATSNRMRLLHETRQERESDLEGELGRGERSALATRFGLRVAFPSVRIEEFVAIARALVERRMGAAPAGLEAAARRFAVDRGQTPRAARQFADLVAAGVIASPA